MTDHQQLTVTINGRFLDTALTGVQRYAWEIVCALDRLSLSGDPLAEGVDFTLQRPWTNAPPLHLNRIREKRNGRRGGHFWEQVTLPRLAAGSKLLNLCNLGPVAQRNAVLCIHDAHVWLVPENYSAAFRNYYRVMLPLLTRTSRQWTTVSHYSETQLRRFGVANRPADAIIGNAVGDIKRYAGRRPDRPNLALPEHFVFALGSAARNKNLALLARLAPRLAKHGLGIVIGGGTNHEIFGLGTEASPDVIRLGRVDDGELAWLYRNALCFLFPSFYEGFGIPPLEAMACGCPVVSSNTSALPEVLGDAPLWRDPRDADGWFDAVLTLLYDVELRAAMIEKGLVQASTHSWDDAGRSYLKLIRSSR